MRHNFRTLSFEDWYDKYGAEAELECQNEFIENDEEATEDDINTRLASDYESYISDYEDYAYEQMKDERDED